MVTESFFRSTLSNMLSDSFSQKNTCSITRQQTGEKNERFRPDVLVLSQNGHAWARLSILSGGSSHVGGAIAP
jgi:hypothetical protein